jgi:hypothetical protein
MRGVRRGIWAVVAIALATGLVAGGVVAGSFDWSTSAPDLGAAIVDEPLTQVAVIPSSDGHSSRGVFAQLTSTGHFCLWDAASPSASTRSGGCNLVDDPLGGDPLRISLSYDGGPAISSVTDARLIGLAAIEVAAVEIVMSDGSLRKASLKRTTVGDHVFRAFGYRVRKSDTRRGIGPVAVVARDASGTEIHREPTGIGG